MMMNKNKLCTINNWASTHYMAKSRIKNEYKELLMSFFLDGEKIPEDSIFVWTPEYKDKRRRDSINSAAIAKVIEDTIVITGSMIDDNKTSHLLLPGTVDKSLNEHLMNIKIYSQSKK